MLYELYDIDTNEIIFKTEVDNNFFNKLIIAKNNILSIKTSTKVRSEYAILKAKEIIIKAVNIYKNYNKISIPCYKLNYPQYKREVNAILGYEKIILYKEIFY